MSHLALNYPKFGSLDVELSWTPVCCEYPLPWHTRRVPQPNGLFERNPEPALCPAGRATTQRGELTSIFTAKLLNFARNPYSVAKILNTFGVLANYEPTAPDARRMFERVLNGRKPHQA